MKIEKNEKNEMYSVVNKRRGKVVKEDLIEGSSTFTVTAHVPVIESFNIGPELRYFFSKDLGLTAHFICRH